MNLWHLFLSSKYQTKPWANDGKSKLNPIPMEIWKLQTCRRKCPSKCQSSQHRSRKRYVLNYCNIYLSGITNHSIQVHWCCFTALFGEPLKACPKSHQSPRSLGQWCFQNKTLWAKIQHFAFAQSFFFCPKNGNSIFSPRGWEVYLPVQTDLPVCRESPPQLSHVKQVGYLHPYAPCCPRVSGTHTANWVERTPLGWQKQHSSIQWSVWHW